MSWSVSTVIRASNIDADLAALVIPYDHDVESDDQLTAAKSHVKAVIASLPQSDYYGVSLNGHATTGHVVEGYNQESISISVGTTAADIYVRQLETQKKALEDQITQLSVPVETRELNPAPVDAVPDEIVAQATLEVPES